MATHSITSRGVDAPAPAIHILLGATQKRGTGLGRAGSGCAEAICVRSGLVKARQAAKFLAEVDANHDNPYGSAPTEVSRVDARAPISRPKPERVTIIDFIDVPLARTVASRSLVNC